MVTPDEYEEKILNQGDIGSRILAEAIKATIGNSSFASIEGEPYQLSGLRIPSGRSAVLHSDVGEGETLERKVESLIQRLLSKAVEIGAEPIGFTNIVDSQTGDETMITRIRDALIDVANARKLVVLNGENAILGYRVVGDANISGTMISMLDSRELSRRGLSTSGIVHTKHGGCYTVFPTNGEFLFMNSDGVGTWHEFVERLGADSPDRYPEFWPRANRNALAMDADDAAKNGGRIMAYSGVFERNDAADEMNVASNVPDEMTKLCAEFGFLGTLQTRKGAICSYKAGLPAFNIGGSAVSIIEDKRLNSLPVPREGDYLVVLRARIPNPRSNGITAKREGMVRMHGQEWHETDWGRWQMDFLSGPCTVFYGFFKQCLDDGLASSVYHMSGGAFNGKLARPLAKIGLFAELDNLFDPDPREVMLAEATSPSIRASFAKCPMGNEAFIATRNPYEVIKRAQREGYDALKCGKITREADGKTGVSFYAMGQEISFSGKD